MEGLFLCAHTLQAVPKHALMGALTKGSFSNWKEKYGKEKKYFSILLWESTNTFPNLK